MANIEDFIKAEEDKMSWFRKVFNNYPIIETTKTLASSARKINPKTHIIIRPSVSQKIIVSLFICPAFFMWITLVKQMFADKELIWVYIGLLCFVSGIIYVVLYHSFFDKKTLFTIFIGHNGISIDDATFSWEDITETYIMTIRGNKRDQHYLLINATVEGFKKFDLGKFSIGMCKLSALIEYYKTTLVTKL